MVTGIERWKEYFNDYKDKYVLIASNLKVNLTYCYSLKINYYNSSKIHNLVLPPF